MAAGVKIFLILVVVLSAFLALRSIREWERAEEIESMEKQYASDPVMLYKTVGIKECEYDSRINGERSGAVLLEGDDLVRAVEYLRRHYGDGIEAVLYINAPEANQVRHGQPALLPLKKKDGVYCSVGGPAGSHDMQPFVDFAKKYQSQIEYQAIPNFSL